MTLTRLRTLFTVAAATVCFMAAATSSDVAAVLTEGFESPVMPSGLLGYQYSPSGSWDFASGAGITGNDSAFTLGTDDAPEGVQAAFVQGFGRASKSLTLAAGAYSISFRAAQRTNVRSNAHFVELYVSGQFLGLYLPGQFGEYQVRSTAAFNFAAGTHTIEFRGFDFFGGDNTTFIDDVVVLKHDTGLRDGGFEQPALAASSFKYSPAGSPWSFASAGISGNNSGFTAGANSAPQGAQVAFIQGGGEVSQRINLASGYYTVSYKATQRVNYQSSFHFVQVLIDGQVVGFITAAIDGHYHPYGTTAIPVAAGMHTVSFKGVNFFGGDNTTFMDDVVVSPAWSLPPVAPAIPGVNG
jgi:hypothetical protein